MSDGDRFDEAWYLRTYPDVARAVEAGALRSGHQHYLNHGKAEGRAPCPMAISESLAMPVLKPLDWPPINVEVSASKGQVEAMLDRVQRNFEFMGEREPHWSVLTSERYRTANIASTEDEFFESGKHAVTELLATAARCGIRLGTTCFELGCGVGRSTVWLADRFESVIGCDISGPHLRIAAQSARRLGKENINFVQINRPDQIRKLPSFDVFFSIIVLQHNPPPVIVRYLSAALCKLTRRGAAYFQLPTYRPGYEFNISDYLASEGAPGIPEMHMVPQQILYGLIDETDCLLGEVREDGATGDDRHISQRFFVVKR